jgi:hypothetical protein
MKSFANLPTDISYEQQLINARECLWLLEDGLVNMPSDYPMDKVSEQVRQVRKAELLVIILEIAIKREAV